MRVTFLHFHRLNHTPPRAMDAAIARARAPVQICDVDSEQPISFFCENVDL